MGASDDLRAGKTAVGLVVISQDSIKRPYSCMPVFGITAEYMCLSTLFMCNSLADSISL